MELGEERRKSQKLMKSRSSESAEDWKRLFWRKLKLSVKQIFADIIQSIIFFFHQYFGWFYSLERTFLCFQTPANDSKAMLSGLPFHGKSTCHWECEQWQSNVNLPLFPCRSGAPCPPRPPPSGHERSYCFWPGLDKHWISTFPSGAFEKVSLLTEKKKPWLVLHLRTQRFMHRNDDITNLAGRHARILLHSLLNGSQISYINAGHTQWVPWRLHCVQKSQIPDPLTPLAARRGSTSPHVCCPPSPFTKCLMLSD